MFCGEFDPNHFSNSCIENMEERKSVLNSPYSVWLNQSTVDDMLQSDVEATARWKFAPHAEFNATPALLPTRFQRKDCDRQFCEEQQRELWQHELYAWVDAPDWRQLLVPSHPPMALCFVGSSHSRLLAQYAQHIDKSKVVKFQFIEAKYFKDVNIDRVYGTDDKHSEACTHIVIGASQWSVSWAQHSSPYTADLFKREIHELLKLFAQHKAFDPSRLYLRTTNYNSLGDVYSCVDKRVGYQHTLMLMTYSILHIHRVIHHFLSAIRFPFASSDRRPQPSIVRGGRRRRDRVPRPVTHSGPAVGCCAGLLPLAGQSVRGAGSVAPIQGSIFG